MGLFNSPTCLSPTPRLDPDASVSSDSQNHTKHASASMKKPGSGSRPVEFKGTKRSRSSPRKTKQPRVVGGQQVKTTNSKRSSAASQAVVPRPLSSNPRASSSNSREREGKRTLPRGARQPAASHHLHALGPAPLDFDPGTACDGLLPDVNARLDPSPDLLARLRSMELKLERECGESLSADAWGASNDVGGVSSFKS